MSGIIGHTMYALLGAKAASQRDLPVARIVQRHLSSYLCGAYLGADVGTVPSVICQDTGTPPGVWFRANSQKPFDRRSREVMAVGDGWSIYYSTTNP